MENERHRRFSSFSKEKKKGASHQRTEVMLPVWEMEWSLNEFHYDNEKNLPEHKDPPQQLISNHLTHAWALKRQFSKPCTSLTMEIGVGGCPQEVTKTRWETKRLKGNPGTY